MSSERWTALGIEVQELVFANGFRIVIVQEPMLEQFLNVLYVFLVMSHDRRRHRNGSSVPRRPAPR